MMKIPEMQDEKLVLKTMLVEFAESYCKSIQHLKTRKILLPGRKCSPKIVESFLGYEILIGRKRLTCPDMATARYLKIFAEIGMKEILVPYDPTKTAEFLPGLEKKLDQIKVLVARIGQEKQNKIKLRTAYKKIRDKLNCPSSLS